MTDPKLADMGFRDYLSNALMKLGDAETAYNQLVDGDDAARDEVTNLLADAAIAISLGSSRALSDAVALSCAARGDITPGQVEDADMWAAIAADVDAGLSDMGSDPVADSDRDAVCERDIAARGDLLAAPPFAGPEPQTDREDRTAREHDESTQDWNRAAEEDDQ